MFIYRFYVSLTFHSIAALHFPLFRTVGDSLVTYTVDDFIATAVHIWRAHYHKVTNGLYINPILSAVRKKLSSTSLILPLFDTARLVRATERAYQAMWEQYKGGRSLKGRHEQVKGKGYLHTMVSPRLPAIVSEEELSKRVQKGIMLALSLYHEGELLDII